MCNTNDMMQIPWDEDIIAFAGYWEPVSFWTRMGRSYKGIEDDGHPYSEEMVKKLADIGINLAVWHYYKGLGIETEQEEMQRTAEFFKLLDRRGIGKGVYVNIGSFFADTFLVENPEAEGWLSQDQYGQPHQYSEFYRNYYRFRPCMSHLEFGDYVGSAASKAIKEAGAELILLDNSAQMPCYCDNCHAGFVKYVQNKYPAEGGEGTLSFKQRFGYEYRGRFELPRGTARLPIDNLPSAHEPGLYEWVRYRQHLYENLHRRVTEIVRAASDRVRINWNIALDHGEFPGLVWGIDPETSYRCQSDFFFSEDENHARAEGGRIISHISTYKYGRAMGNRVFVHNIPPNATEDIRMLNYAEAAVFNQGCLGRVMWATDDENDYDILKRALSFFRRNRDVYLGVIPVSKAALYRCSESETAYWSDAILSRYAVEQVLIKNSIQYDHITNDTFDLIGNYRLLICANTAAVSDRIVGKISDFIKSGGKLFCTESSLSRDEYMRKRIKNSESGLFGERDSSIGRANGRADVSKILKYLGLDEEYADSIYYLPDLAYQIPFIWNPRSSIPALLDHNYFAEPLNRDEVLSLIRQALQDTDLEIGAPRSVIAGMFDLRDGTRAVHFLDYEAGRELSDVRVHFAVGRRRPEKAVFKSLDDESEVNLSYRDGHAECKLPKFRTYGFLRA